MNTKKMRKLVNQQMQIDAKMFEGYNVRIVTSGCDGLPEIHVFAKLINLMCIDNQIYDLKYRIAGMRAHKKGIKLTIRAAGNIGENAIFNRIAKNGLATYKDIKPYLNPV